MHTHGTNVHKGTAFMQVTKQTPQRHYSANHLAAKTHRLCRTHPAFYRLYSTDKAALAPQASTIERLCINGSTVAHCTVL